MQCRSPAFADLRHSVTKARAPNKHGALRQIEVGTGRALAKHGGSRLCEGLGSSYGQCNRCCKRWILQH